jgi:hypothetical protein
MLEYLFMVRVSPPFSVFLIFLLIFLTTGVGSYGSIWMRVMCIGYA